MAMFEARSKLIRDDPCHRLHVGLRDDAAATTVMSRCIPSSVLLGGDFASAAKTAHTLIRRASARGAMTLRRSTYSASQAWLARYESWFCSRPRSGGAIESV